MEAREPSDLLPPTRGPVLRFRRALQPPRVWSPADAFLNNLMTTNVAVALGVLLVAGAGFYFPIGSLTAAVLIAGSACMAEAVVYAFLATSFPRSGGDYVFQHRLLSEGAAAVISFTGIVTGGALWMAIAAWFASRVAVGPFLVMFGMATHAQVIVRVGNLVMSTAGIVVLGLLATAWSAAMNTLGMKRYARVQRRLVLIGLLALSMLVAYLALTRADLNESAYRAIVFGANEVGFRRFGRLDGFAAVLKLLPIVAFGLFYPGWSSFQAGEVKRASELRTQSLVIVGSKALGVLFGFILLPLPLRHVGEELWGASAYLVS